MFVFYSHLGQKILYHHIPTLKYFYYISNRLYYIRNNSNNSNNNNNVNYTTKLRFNNSNIK